MSNKMEEKAMKPAAKRALVPRRRFPEFRDAGKWETKRLGELLLGHPNYGVNAPAVPYSEDLPAYLRITDISDEGYFLRGKKTSVAINVVAENYLRDGDIVLARTGASVGKSYKYRNEDGKLVFAGFLIRIKPDPKKVDSTFLFDFFSTQQYWNWVSVTSARSGQPGINGNEYATLPIPIPLHEMGTSEQQKIAGCLSSLDELVSLEVQKLDALKAHKKGLMQQLFPAEGETLPKLRFSEFQDAGEWKEKKLGEIADVLMCKRIFAKETNDQEGIPFFKIGTLGGKPDAFISKQLFDEYKSKYNYPNKGEILITCSGTVGKCLPYDGKDAYYQDSNIVWIDNPTLELSNEFLHYLLLNINWGSLNSTTITRIYGPDLRGLSLVFPTDPQEQQKITSFLSSIDVLLTAQTQRLDTLKAHKKGLMQQLFPELEEVQG